MVFVATVVCWSFTGCAPVRPESICEDEAKDRADAEGINVKDAAKAYFYPYKEEYGSTDGQKLPDFFREMDAVSTPTAVPAWPDQLIDKNARTPHSVAALELNDSERLGRNTWMVWCAGNEGFWDYLANDSLGFIDFVKLLDTRIRNERFRDGGLINEPGMTRGARPSPDEFGLWLDVPADERVRHWREHYVKSTFSQIASGTHKSQIFCDKLYSGRRDDLRPQPYVPSSEYLESDQQESAADATFASEYAARDAWYNANIPPPDVYGLSSGVLGLRLFPNPYFNEEARRRWDPERYYNDETYWKDPKLVRPYRVGMSCAFCHASFHPLVPPRDAVNPEWRNISGSIGAQYLRIRYAVGNLLTSDQFVYHLLDSQPPGTIDTSLIASDNINNPNAMNAIFRLTERAVLSYQNPPEKLTAESRRLPSLYSDPQRAPQGVRDLLAARELLNRFDDANVDNPRYTPRVLFDGADSIGAWGALSRVYLNIGSYWEHWNQLHDPLVGFTPQRPFTIADCENHSVVWNATQLRVAGLRDYFLKVSAAMPLLSAPGADARLEPVSPLPTDRPLTSEQQSRRDKLIGRHIDLGKLALGRKAFARNCIVCHSSIQPEHEAITVDVAQESLKRIVAKRNNLHAQWESAGEFWEHDPGQWLADPDYLAWAEAAVELPEFWNNNYLSIDYRIPINVVQTNSGRAMATNAMTGHMWEDFASQSLKRMPAVGVIPFFNPYAGESGEDQYFEARHRAPQGAPPGGGGPGFYRVPTLVSIWNTAPLLHNNSLGLFNNDPSVDGRLDAFDDAIRKLLSPERRLESSSYNYATPERLKRDHGLIWRTTEDTYLVLSSKYVPHALSRFQFLPDLNRWFPWLTSVFPLWLPSALLLLSGFVLLLLADPVRRRRLGYQLLVVAALFVLALFLAKQVPAFRPTQWLLAVTPPWLPLATIVLVALAMVLPLSWKWTRRTGYLSVLLALIVGGIVYFNAGGLGDIRIGPIPAGTPVNLIANINPEADPRELKRALGTVIDGLAEIRSRHLKDADADKVMREKIAPALLAVSKCPDFVMDRGHAYEWFRTMTEEEKEALIELLKTF